MANPEGRHGATQVFCEVGGFAIELGPDQLRPSGAFVPTTTPQPLDSEIELTLRSPVGDAVLRALVVQVIDCEQAALTKRPAGYGVLFLDLADDQRAFIGLTLDALDRAQRAKLEAETKRRMTPARPRPRPRIPSSPLEPPAIATRKRKLSAEGSETLRKLRTELEKLPTRSPFAVLGLEPDADQEAAHQAYLAASKRCHPHVYARFDSEEVSTAATELFIAYKRAYSVVRVSARPPSPAKPTVPASSTPSASGPAPAASTPPVAASITTTAPMSRAEILAAAASSGAAPALRGGAASDSEPERRSSPPPARAVAAVAAIVTALPRASIPVRRPAAREPGAISASAMARTSIPVRAVAATSERPQQPAERRAVDTEIALGAALKHLAGSRFDQAELELERLCEQCPEHRDSQVWLHVCRARRQKAARRPEAALAHYRAVLALDPDHREATEHVGRKKRGGLVGKWFSGDDE